MFEIHQKLSQLNQRIRSLIQPRRSLLFLDENPNVRLMSMLKMILVRLKYNLHLDLSMKINSQNETILVIFQTLCQFGFVLAGKQRRLLRGLTHNLRREKYSEKRIVVVLNAKS